MAINFNFTSAPCTIFGEGALKKASPYFNRFGKKALIVTGKIITKSGLTSQVQNMLSELGIESVVFNDLPGEPDDIMINNGIKVYKDEEWYGLPLSFHNRIPQQVRGSLLFEL